MKIKFISFYTIFVSNVFPLDIDGVKMAYQHMQSPQLSEQTLQILME